MLSMTVKVSLSRLFGSLAWRRNPRHLAIAGVSYCGSTLLSNILGSLPDMSSIGESHWLTARREQDRTVQADLEREDYGIQVHCRRCGEGCKVLDRSFRLGLQRDPSHWYEKIRKRLGGRILVSADKNISKLKRFDPDLNMHLLILFKSPEQAAISHLRQQARKTNRATTNDDLIAYLDKWASSYQSLLDCENRGKKIVLSFEAFCSSPAKHLKKLCRAVGARFDPNVVEIIDEDQHCLGGNRRVMAALNDSSNIRIEGPQASKFDVEQMRIVREHSRSSAVYADLMSMYENSFAVSRDTKTASTGTRHDRHVTVLPFVTEEITAAIDEGLGNLALERRFSEEKLAGKRRFYERITHDPRPHLEARKTRLLKSGLGSPAAIRLLDHVLQNMDFARYASLQESFLTTDHIREHIHPLRYLDLDYWLAAKLKIVLLLELDQKPPLSILDIGCGCSHFGFLCQCFGHRVLGTDIDVVSEDGQQEQHVFDALSNFFGVERRLFRIMPWVALPDFGRRFDVVTALMAKFDFYEDGSRWGEDEWAFFLEDLATRVLNKDGQFFLGLNVADGVDHILLNMERLGATVDHDQALVHFSNMNRFRQKTACTQQAAI